MRCLYADAFPIQSRRKGASSNGVYMSSGVSTFEELQQLDSYEQLAHFPKGVDPFACLRVFNPSWKRLQAGFRTVAGPADARREIFYHGGIGALKGDFPQQQQITGSKGAGANQPDRNSHIPKDKLSDLDYDIALNRKTLDERRSVRTMLASLATKEARTQEEVRQGILPDPSPFED